MSAPSGTEEGMKTIWQSYVGFGGYFYRVSSDGARVNISERRSSTDFKVVKRMSAADFSDWADEVALFNPYDQNPAKIERLIREDV